MNTLKETAIRAAKLAGRQLLIDYSNLKDSQINKKGRHDLVTKADLDANKIIIQTIKKSFPNHNFLSEETGLEKNSNGYRWVIDPLDGTTNYVLKNPLFCTVICLMKNDEPIFSVTYAPVLDEIFIAEKGKGATLNGEKITVSNKKKINYAISLIAKAHSKKSRRNEVRIMKNLYNSKLLNVKKLGSTALDFAYVATGRVESIIVVPPEISLWDTLAGILLVKEAGGKVTNFKNKKNDFENKGILASNGKIHNSLLKEINK